MYVLQNIAMYQNVNMMASIKMKLAGVTVHILGLVLNVVCPKITFNQVSRIYLLKYLG